jgi:hypothetical protein
MLNKLKIHLALAILTLSGVTGHGRAQTESKPIYAKTLVLEVIHRNPDMLDVIFHVTRPGASDNYAIAAYTKKEEGGKSGDDDMGVVKTGVPLVEVQKDGVRIGVLVQLKDKHRHAIGALGLMYVYHAGDDPKEYLRRSEKVRDNVAKKIPNVAALFEQ